MTRLQKVIIAILGLLNIVVIVVLGNIVVWNILQPHTGVLPLGTSPSLSDPQLQNRLGGQVAYCPSTVMTSLPLSLHPVVDWEAQQLTITLHEVYTTTIPPASSAQHLWTAMDAVANALRAGCAPPYTITLIMSAQGRTGPEGISETHHHIVELKGQGVMAWTIGTLSSEALANQSAYRRVKTKTIAHSQ